MPNGFTGCVLVKLPIVIADIVDSITVDNVTCLEEQAKKVDHIDVEVRDLEADPVFTEPGGGCVSPKATKHFGEPDCGPKELRHINVHGTLHKQIFYVNKNDDVRHMQEDIFFSDTIDLEPPLPVQQPGNVDIEFKDVDVDVSFNLPRASRIQQTATIRFVIKITEDQQLFIQTCIPDRDLIGRQVLANTGFEAFTGCILAVWQQSNAAPGQPGRNGGFSVGLGGPPAGFLPPGGCTADPTQPASISQTIPVDVIRPGLRYEFCFYITEAIPPGSVADYVVEARVAFFDAVGNVINSAAVQTFTEEQINATWVQKCVTAAAPEGAVSGLVSIVFTPETGNGAYVLVDDATLTIRA